MKLSEASRRMQTLKVEIDGEIDRGEEQNSRTRNEVLNKNSICLPRHLYTRGYLVGAGTFCNFSTLR